MHQNCPLTIDDDSWHHQFGQETSVNFTDQKLILDDVNKHEYIDVVSQLQMSRGVTGATFKLISYSRRNGSVGFFNHYFWSVNSK